VRSLPVLLQSGESQIHHRQARHLAQWVARSVHLRSKNLHLRSLLRQETNGGCPTPKKTPTLLTRSGGSMMYRPAARPNLPRSLTIILRALRQLTKQSVITSHQDCRVKAQYKPIACKSHLKNPLAPIISARNLLMKSFVSAQQQVSLAGLATASSERSQIFATSSSKRRNSSSRADRVLLRYSRRSRFARSPANYQRRR
jgi:hypothetical protein